MLDTRFGGNERFSLALCDRRRPHAAFGFGDDFRDGRIVAGRHDMNAGDTRDGGEFGDQVNANADTLAHRVRRFFHAGNWIVGDDRAKQMALHPLRRLRGAKRIDADQDRELTGQAGFRQRAHIAAEQSRIHAELGLHELGSGGDFGGQAFRLPAGWGVDRHVGGAEEEGSLPRHLASGGQLAFVAQPPGGFDQRARVDVEYGLGVRLIAGLWVVARQHQDVVNTERGCPHQFALERNAVLVAAGDLQDRLDAGVDQDRRSGERRHMRPRAGAISNINGVREAPQRNGLAQQVLRVAGDRRGDLCRHHKPARPQPLGEGAGKGGYSVGHGKLAWAAGAKGSAYIFWRLTAIVRFRAPFLDRKDRDR